MNIIRCQLNIIISYNWVFPFQQEFEYRVNVKILHTINAVQWQNLWEKFTLGEGGVNKIHLSNSLSMKCSNENLGIINLFYELIWAQLNLLNRWPTIFSGVFCFKVVSMTPCFPDPVVTVYS